MPLNPILPAYAPMDRMQARKLSQAIARTSTDLVVRTHINTNGAAVLHLSDGSTVRDEGEWETHPRNQSRGRERLTADDIVIHEAVRNREAI